MMVISGTGSSVLSGQRIVVLKGPSAVYVSSGTSVLSGVAEVEAGVSGGGLMFWQFVRKKSSYSNMG